MKRPVHARNGQSNVVSLGEARAQRAPQFDPPASHHVGVRQKAVLDATLRTFEARDRAPVAAAQVFIRPDGSVETSIKNVEPEHIPPLLTALRRIQDILIGSTLPTAKRLPKERGMMDGPFLLMLTQIVGVSIATYINTTPWIDVALTTGGQLLALAICRYAGRPH